MEAETNLKVKMVNGGKCTQAVVTQSEVWISCFISHVKREQEALSVNPLRQALEDLRDKKHMTILNRANLLAIDNRISDIKTLRSY